MSRTATKRGVNSFVVFVAFLLGGAVVFFARPRVAKLVPSLGGGETARAEAVDHDVDHDHDHDGDHERDADHDHDGDREESDHLALNEQALRNIGLKSSADVLVLEPTEYAKSFAIPGITRYRPGRSLVEVTAPASGSISKIFAEEGAPLLPGDPLFEIRLNREETTACQLELLALLRRRDLLESERERLSRLDPGFEPKTRREIELRTNENESAIETQKRTLINLGLSNETIEETIVRDRDLVATLIARVPEPEDGEIGIVASPGRSDSVDEDGPVRQLEKITVEKGRTVSLGDPLCVISDLRKLRIEGRAFESDEAALNSAYARGANVVAVFSDALDPNGEKEMVSGLKLRSVSNRVNEASRVVSCYVELDNYKLETPEAAEGKVAPLNWRFKPGRRCELEIETEKMENVFVVPVDAVAQEGSEFFLFEYEGEAEEKSVWHCHPVVALYRTTREIVLANDGSIEEGAKIARRGANQLYVALTGGGGKLQSACPCGDHDRDHEH